MKSLEKHDFPCSRPDSKRQSGLGRNVFSTFLGLFLLIAPSGVYAQTLISQEGLAEDVQILRRSLLLLHPGLYRFNTPGGIETAFRALERDLAGPRTLAQTFLALSRFTATIRCGATYPSFFNQNEAVEREVFDGMPKLPFLFRWEDDRMIVTASSEDQLKPGDEIEQIDGMHVRDLGQRLLACVKADGSNNANRWAQLELTGMRDREAFDVYQPLLMPLQRGRNFRVQLAGEDAPAYELQPVTSRAAKGVKEQWSYEVIDGRLAHLRMGSFDVYDGEFDWKGFLADAFGDMKQRGLRHVALDIRGNQGGADEVLVELVKYIVWQPAVIPGVQRLVRYETVPEDIRPYLSASDRSFYDLRGKVYGAGGGMFLYRDAEREALLPSSDALIAKYYLLVDGHNAAAAFTLAQFLQENKLATLIGETTGGNRRGINGGQFFFLKLPNSGIVIDIPLIASVPIGAAPDTGIQPDEPASPEAALARARKLAAGN